jgi:hypothetical protein
MRQLNEILFGEVSFTEKEDPAKKDVLGTVECPFIVCDVKNTNGRSYPAAIVKNEVARVQKRLKEGHYPFGSGEHPEGAEVKIGDISHRIVSLHFDEKTRRAVAKLEILNTSKGRDLAVILRKGKVGVSARGVGNTRPGVMSDQEICADYQLHGVDFTLSPSFEECTAGGLVFESARFVEEAPRPSCGEPSDLECRIAGVPVALYPKHHYQDPAPKKILSESVVDDGNRAEEELTDEEVVAVLDGMSDEEIEVLENMSEEELDKIVSMSDAEFDAYLASLEGQEGVGEQILDNSKSLTEQFQSLDAMIRSAVKNTFGEGCWIRDFSENEIIFTVPSTTIGLPPTPDVLLSVDYQVGADGVEFTSDPVIVKKTEDYIPEEFKSIRPTLQETLTPAEEQLETRFGQLSEQEMRLTGSSQFGKSKKVELTETEYRYLSPKEAAILREEKFGKKK